MMDLGAIRVLLVEDDEDDCFLTRDLLKDIKSRPHEMSWESTYESGLRVMLRNQHDVCLVDYRLGAHNGVDLLRAAQAQGCGAPIIILTGLGEQQVDLAAMKAGAADYLVKGRLDSNQLERSIRYAIERGRAAARASFEQARLAAFGAQIGLELTRRSPLATILESCAQIMARYLSAALAQVWIYDNDRRVLEPQAHAGPVFEAAGLPSNLPVPAFNLEELTSGKPIFIPSLDVPHCGVLDPAQVRREKLVSFVGYPLLVEDRLVGCLSLFAREPLAETILQELGSVANGIASCIQRKQADVRMLKLAAFPRVNPNPVLEFNADGTLGYANDAAFQLAKSLGKDQIADILPAGVGAIVVDCLARGTKRLQEEVCCSERTITWSFFPVADSGVVHCYGADITERLSLEAQFRHSQKLESVGQMAAGIAHDFNNMLTIIQGYTDCLLTRAQDEDPGTVPLRQIAGAARRAASLTRQLLLFSRKQVIQARAADLNSVLPDFVDLMPRLLGEDIALKTEYAPDLPAIEADTGMIEQVVMNLAVNARDAMPKGGCLTITTRLAEITEAGARQRPEARPGRFVCLSVKDTGTGMDAKTVARIFEPFFSTKEVGRGTGLGLATAYGIMKQHQGWIEVATEIGMGTTFTLYFPALGTSAVATSDQNEAPAAVRGGSETILLVEDESVVRDFVCETLRHYKYRVLEAATGVEALKVWEQNNGQIDLLLTDMVMPEGMTGSHLATHLRERKPSLKIIFTSGYSPEIIGKSFKEGDTEFLQKPYRAPLLAQRVRKCLDTPLKPDAELLPA
jgi:signal transduction histidine kinase/DNA-binding response OmpR family regulator